MTFYWPDPNDFDFEKDVDIEVNQKLNFDTKVNLDKKVNIDINVKSDTTDIKGNFASVTFSVEALGKDTIAEADVAVLVIEDKLSSVDGVLIAGTS